MGTRLWQCGAETGTDDEMPDRVGNQDDAPQPSTDTAYTGSYSLKHRYVYGSTGVGKVFSSDITRIMCGMYMRHAGSNAFGGLQGVMFRWIDNDAPTPNNFNMVGRAEGTSSIDFRLQNVLIDSISIAAAGLDVHDVWQHIGIIVDTSSGYLKLYVDGALKWTVNEAMRDMTAFFVGGDFYPVIPNQAVSAWNQDMYMDDIYIDNVEGDSDTTPIPRRFLWSIADGNGDASNWDGSDGDSADNYELVENVPADGDVTHVYTEAAATIDTYECSDITLPAGYEIVAVIPIFDTRRYNVVEQIKVGLWDGLNAHEGTAQDPTQSYSCLWERYTTQPDGSAWNEVDFNAMMLRAESDGF